MADIGSWHCALWSPHPRQVRALLQLKAALVEIMDQPGAERPERVRYFRGQMQTIITRALIDLDIKPVPSRRCFTLISAPPALRPWVSWVFSGAAFPRPALLARKLYR